MEIPARGAATGESLLAILSDDGKLLRRPAYQPSEAELILIYRTMVLSRQSDERMISLQRQGRISFYTGAIGEEAAIVASAVVLRERDWTFPSYREVAAGLARGYPLRAMIAQNFGNSEDWTKGRQTPCHYVDRERNFVSMSSPVGTQIPQAVGAAWAAKIRGEDIAVLVYFGDGATSQGDFHVGMNFAGVFKAPVVFFCRNNQWAISVPVSRQTASRTLAQKAAAYGFAGLRVDGNDALAVYEATKQAVEKARSGGGPTLIEAVTYRMSAHSTSDDPRVYREEKALAEWKRKDPIDRLRAYLESIGLWGASKEEELQREVREKISTEIKRAEQMSPPPLESLFEDIYAELPRHLSEQMDDCSRSISLPRGKPAWS